VHALPFLTRAGQAEQTWWKATEFDIATDPLAWQRAASATAPTRFLLPRPQRTSMSQFKNLEQDRRARGDPRSANEQLLEYCT
jgi:hypothetical protein